MGRTIIGGEGAINLIEKCFPRKVSNMSVNQGRYGFLLNGRGGIIDDLTVFRLKEKEFLLVYNASNRQKDFSWIKRASENLNASVTDVSDQSVMLAVQGPKAINTLQRISDKDLASIRRYWGDWIGLGDFNVLATRTGYTGEDGFEIYLWNTPITMTETAERLLWSILKAGEQHGIKPCGLGARDTLRLEAGMCLYGNDIDENTSPLEAGFASLIDFDKSDFIGRTALIEQKEKGTDRLRVGVRLTQTGIPRHGYELYSNNGRVGSLTSGTFSPLLKVGIGLGYIMTEYSKIGTEIQVKIRDKLVDALVVETPFYDTGKYGYKRVVQNTLSK
jgi:aminomethyltransferase